MLPAVSIINRLRENGKYQIKYVGGHKGIEKEIIGNLGIEYFPVSTGKLRRYLSLENLFDIFRLFYGFIQSLKLAFQFRNSGRSIVFSTGGFVSVPMVIAGRIMGHTVFLHEQTSRAGLANRIGAIFAHRIFVSFQDSLAYFPRSKVVYSGYPLRDECFDQEIRSYEIAGTNLAHLDRPILFITGGGNGSRPLNEWIKKNLDWLCVEYFVIHQVGSLFYSDYAKLTRSNYLPLAFVAKGMIDLFKLSHIVISRAGAGTVCELLALGKPSILVPLPHAQKNEQYFNALEAKQKLGSIIVEEKTINDISLKELFGQLAQSSQKPAMAPNGLDFLIKEIDQMASK